MSPEPKAFLVILGVGSGAFTSLISGAFGVGFCVSGVVMVFAPLVKNCSSIIRYMNASKNDEVKLK